MTLLIKLKRNSRSRVISLAMLSLIAHAAFVSVTHHHPVRNEAATSATEKFVANDKTNSQSAPDSGGDTNCLSCRLQRNFTSNVQAPCFVVQLLSEPLRRETPKPQTVHWGSSLLLFGRAPPLNVA